MEKRLNDAATKGDVTTLYQLIQEDPLILVKAATVDCEDKNPLHLAAMLGYVDFMKAILQLNSACYYFMCLARDRDGRNPLQLAAIYGQLAVLEVLLHTAGIQAALEKTDGGGTILHLCVKYTQLEALKLLVKALKDSEFLNAKNEDGMTILHLAIYYHQNQTIKYLLDETEVRANIKNANGKTALDLLLAQGDIDSDIRSSLEEAEALLGKHVQSTEELKTKQHEWFQKVRDSIMVVASLIATMAFQAGVSPPGGVWQDDLMDGPNPHRAGEAVMAQTHPNYYRHLIRANTIAFVSCLSTIILVIRGWGVPSKKLLPLIVYVMWLAIATIAIAYGISLVTVAPKGCRSQLNDASEIALIVLAVWSCLMVTWIYEMYYERKRWVIFRRMGQMS